MRENRSFVSWRGAVLAAASLVAVSTWALRATAAPILGSPTTGTVTVNAGSSAVYENLKIDFVAVTSDSRCPVGTTCAWAGNAAVQLRVTPIQGGTAATVPLTLNSQLAPTFATVFDWRLAFSTLTPAPTANLPKPDPTKYVLTLKVDKAADTTTVARPKPPTIVASTGTDLMPRAARPSGPTVVTIDIGKLATFQDKQIKFVAVLQEGRCPVGVTCPNPGNAKVRVNVNGTNLSLGVADINSFLAPTSAKVGGLTLAFVSLLPLPDGGVEKPTTTAYKLTLNVVADAVTTSRLPN